MRRLILILLVGFVLWPQEVRAEKIANFRSFITIEKPGTILVMEEITYDFEGLSRHGIYRSIPFLKTNAQGEKFQLAMSDFAVSFNGRSHYPFTQSRQNGQIVLRIGEADKTITGTQLYQIKYRVGGALSYYSEHDELYWNSTGNGWDVPIEKAETIIQVPSGVSSESVRLECFTGVKESQSKNCAYLSSAPQTYTFATNLGLSPHEGLTVVFGFPKGVVAELKAQSYLPFWESPLGKLLALLITLGVATLFASWYLIFPFWIVYQWFKNGRDPVSPTGQATAWFEPPKIGKHTLTPAEVGTLVDEKVEVRDILAMVVDLARRGYYKIEERKKNDFYFVMQKDYHADAHLQNFEKKFLLALFSTKSTVRIKDKKLYLTFEEIKTQLYERVVELQLFPKNPNSIRNFYIVMMMLGLFTFNFLLFLAAALFGLQLPQKTVLGVEAANKAKALKGFLSSQERQLAYQADRQLLFEKLLPYAVAFGVEQLWAKRFAQMALKAPEWYASYQNKPFTSAFLVSNLNRSFTSVKSTFVSPTSSSQGFSSGFSGGSSGGGGGGGGGGSW
jgi:hypothetical protein